MLDNLKPIGETIELLVSDKLLMTSAIKEIEVEIIPKTNLTINKKTFVITPKIEVRWGC